MTTQQPDVEVSLFELSQAFLKRKKLLAICMAIGLGTAFIYNAVADPVYGGRSSFFASDSESPTTSAFSRYSALLGAGSSSGIKQYVVDTIGSRRIQLYTAKQMRPFYQDKIDQLIDDGLLNDTEVAKDEFVQGELRLSGKVGLAHGPKRAALDLTYEHTNPEVVYAVLQHYIDFVSDFTIQAQLSAKRNNIVMLDPPEIPRYPIKPKKRMNLVLGVFLAGVTWFVLTFFMEVIPLYRRLAKEQLT